MDLNSRGDNNIGAQILYAFLTFLCYIVEVINKFVYNILFLLDYSLSIKYIRCECTNRLSVTQ